MDKAWSGGPYDVGGGPTTLLVTCSDPLVKTSPVTWPSRAPLRRGNPLTCSFAAGSIFVGRH